jgi:DNA-binding Xre family transcriptional regulator
MISYKPLFRTLLDKNMKLTDLNKILPTSVTSKFKKDAHVNTATLEKICLLLGCSVQDVIEILPDQEQRNK